MAYRADSIIVAVEAALRGIPVAIADIARTEHAKVMQADPRPRSFTRTVDGVKGASEDRVKPHGIIVYRYPRLGEVVRFAMTTLFKRSPVDFGVYRSNHLIFVDGTQVTDGTSISGGEEIVILNPLKYSRKIEQGRMKMRVSGTDHVYEQSAQAIKRRFGDIANIHFIYHASIGHLLIKRRQGSNIPREMEREERAPALRITAKH